MILLVSRKRIIICFTDGYKVLKLGGGGTPEEANNKVNFGQ